MKKTNKRGTMRAPKNSETKMIEELVGSKSKIRILHTLISNPEKEFYELELAKKAKISPTGVIKAIESLVKRKVINEREIGRMKLYLLNMDNELTKAIKRFFKELHGFK
ncbi:MAG: hypothetical protein HY929_03845 [Euryarchaeota archaeon]|nr:hypothetical protein [Euryarchaeota archaeon]